MHIILQFIFWISVFGLVHSYVFYPLILRFLARNRKPNAVCYTAFHDLPQLSVIMSLYNEEAVVKEKMQSLIALDYPKEKLMFYIGSDCSDDQTNAIMLDFQSQLPNLKFFPFKTRRGKPKVVNDITKIAFETHGQNANHILLMTDASVMLQANTAFELVKHFKHPDIMLVDSNMMNKGMKADGISKLERQYISSEVTVKHHESLAFGKMIGPFGGCYALRSSHFSMIPDKFLVDDFYITLRAFEKGGMAINELEAICYESLPDSMQEEYRRKSRISAGNFQNLHTFRHLLLKGDSLSFAFLSHKVLRWLGPFFIIFAAASGLVMAIHGNIVYQILFLLMMLGLIGFPLLDFLFKKIKIHIMPFRALRYFTMMNIALLEGFFKYIKGVKNNVWQPTKRD